jgi:copper(I)-binding protein
MHRLDSVVVLPHDSVVFGERGLHVMANGLRAPLGLGDTVAVRLRFRGTRVDTLRALVRE